MDWNDIKWFAQVVEHGSFSAAARANDSTQATVSRHIQQLERRLGAALFQRGPQGSQLTQVALQLVETAQQMQRGYEGFDQAFRQLAGGSQHIVVTCGGLIGLFLSKHIARLHAGLEQVDIDLKTTNQFLDLEKGEADLALRNLRPERGMLTSKRLQADNYGRFSVFGSDKFFSPSQFKTLEDLQQIDWISYGHSMSTAPTARWIQQHIDADRITFRMNNALMILEAAKENPAVALLPQFIGRETMGLAEVFGPVPDLDFQLWAVRRESSLRDANISRLIANIELLFSRESNPSK